MLTIVKYCVLVLGFSFIGMALTSDEVHTGPVEGINWVNFDQLQDSMKVKPKRVFVKIYTTWCGPCKLMDKKTLSKSRITEPLHDYYYSVAFDAEQIQNIKFKDSTFNFNPNLGRGIHNLALHLGKEAGNLSYPTVVILDENLDVLYRYPGFMSVLNLEEVLFLYKDLKK